MKNVKEFITWAMTKASPSRIPAGSTLCIPLNQVGKDGIWEYLYGTTGTKCTQARLDNAYAKYYKGWGWSKKEYDNVTAGWVQKGVMVCDCQGLEDCFSKSDTNAKGNYSRYCTDKGRISEINREYIIGEAVFVGSTPTQINHVGWVCGFATNGEPLIVHERGIAHGCVIERMSSCGKKWTYRGLMKNRYAYDAFPVLASTPITIKPAATVLRITKPLMRSGAIKDLQDALNAMGYDCGKADGILGEQSLKGIRAFCEAHKNV